MTASGVATFTYEVLWTRLISHVLGGSVPAFAVMLAGFLIGIAVGSAIASRLAKTAKMARVGFVICQLGIALAAAATFFAINQFTPDKGGLFINSLFSLAVLLPSTLFIGATFPFAVRILAKSANDAPLASARVYAWNTVGAIFGAAFAGYFLIPAAKYEGAIQVAIYLNLLLAVCTVYLIKFESKSLFLKTIPAALVLLFAVFYNPEWPKNIVTFSPFTQAKEPEKENVFYDVGRSSTVLMTAESGFYRLRNNGLPEAAISMKGMPRSWPTYSILSMLPTIARPDAKSMMVAGFGGGVVVEGISPSIEEIDVLELEPKVIEANRLISNLRDIDPLKDPRVNIIYNDARSALNLTTKKYDIIVSQPSHPWTAGASHLYTQEYMQLVEQHLTKNGVFLQWMNTSFTDEFLLRSLAATLVDTFEYVRIYQFTPSVLSFLASNEPIEIERQIVSTGRPFSDHPDYFESRGYYSAEMILAGLAMDTAGVKRFSSTGQIVTDNFNTLGTRSALAIESKKVITVNRVADLILEHSPLFNVDSWVYNDLIDNLKIPYLSSLLPRLGGNDAYSKFHLNLAQRNNYKAFGTLHTILLSQGKIDEAREALISGLKVNKNDNEQKYKLLATYLENDELGQLEPDLEKVLETLGSVPKAVLENLKYLDFSNNEVDKLRAIDDTLAQSKQSDTWYVPALRLRAIWRSRLSKTENNKEIAKEALNLIEIAIANSSDFWILESRLELATLIGDELKVLRSVESMIKVWSQQISIFSQLKEFPENFSFENKKNSLKRAAKTLSNYNCLSDEICDKLSQANETIETYLEAYQQLQLKFASVNNAQN